MEKEKAKEKRKVKCRNCGHEWMTTCDLKRVTCPGCSTKIPNPYFRKVR
jgi:DNA-directed RNA polymerase subunit RPC12/RpoP